MAKLTLVDLASETNFIADANANGARIEEALENTLSLDGTLPNAMNANIDMNSNRMLNLPAPISNNEPARYGDLLGSGLITITGQTVASAVGNTGKVLKSNGTLWVADDDDNTNTLGFDDLVDPGLDRIVFFDDSQGAMKFLTVGTGLQISGTTITPNLIGIEDLTDPAADRILFWDESQNATKFLTTSFPLEISTVFLGFANPETTGTDLGTSVDTANDWIWIWEAASNAWKKINPINLTTAATGTGETKYRTANHAGRVNNTLAVDDMLVGWTLEAGEFYKFEGTLFFSGNSSGDFKFQLVPNGAMTDLFASLYVTDDNVIQIGGLALDIRSATGLSIANTNPHAVTISGYCDTGAATSVDLWWAQNTTDAGSTILLKGSFLTFTKIS